MNRPQYFKSSACNNRAVCCGLRWISQIAVMFTLSITLLRKVLFLLHEIKYVL